MVDAVFRFRNDVKIYGQCIILLFCLSLIFLSVFVLLVSVNDNLIIMLIKLLIIFKQMYQQSVVNVNKGDFMCHSVNYLQN